MSKQEISGVDLNYKEDNMDSMYKKVVSLADKKYRGELELSGQKEEDYYNLYVYLYWLKVELKRGYGISDEEIEMRLSGVNYYEEVSKNGGSRFYKETPIYWGKELMDN